MDAADDEPRTTVLDLAVVGARFAGRYLLHRLRGMGLAVKVFDKADGVGGTWHWNRYPGARCDIGSLDYCSSFSRELLDEWRWTERYGAQPEILRHPDHIADRFDLRCDIAPGTEVVVAGFDADRAAWLLETGDGPTARPSPPAGSPSPCKSPRA